jgi:hypothetical protein
MQSSIAMSDKRTALLALIAERLAEANGLIPVAQRWRFPGFRHPPMLFHWHDEWDDMPVSDLLDVCARLNEIVGRLEKYC